MVCRYHHHLYAAARLLLWCDVAAPRVKPTAVHDTHGQFTKLPKLTPAELSRMKAEKEARDAQELLMRRRNDELARQHLLREQAQRAQGPPMPPNAVRYYQSRCRHCHLLVWIRNNSGPKPLKDKCFPQAPTPTASLGRQTVFPKSHRFGAEPKLV